MAAMEPAAWAAALEGLVAGAVVWLALPVVVRLVVLLRVAEAWVVVLRAVVVLARAVEVVTGEVVVLVVVLMVLDVAVVVEEVEVAEERVTVLAPWDEVTMTVDELLPSAFLIWKRLEYWTMLSSFSQTKRRP